MSIDKLFIYLLLQQVGCDQNFRVAEKRMEKKLGGRKGGNGAEKGRFEEGMDLMERGKRYFA